MMIWTTPPSTLHAAPEVYDACSEQRNTIAPAISVDLGNPTDRSARSGRLESVFPGRQPLHLHHLVEQASLLCPELGLDRAGTDRVDQDPVRRVPVGEEAGEGSSAALATEYSGVAADGRFPEELETLTTRPQPRSAIDGAAARVRRHRRHHVQLPCRVPILVRDVVEIAAAGGAGVVDEHVELAQAFSCLPVINAAASGSVTSAASDSARPPPSLPAAAHSSAASSSAASDRATRSTAAPPRRASGPWLARCRDWHRSRRRHGR